MLFDVILLELLYHRVIRSISFNTTSMKLLFLDSKWSQASRMSPRNYFEITHMFLTKQYYFLSLSTCDALRDLVLFVQFKKREKY